MGGWGQRVATLYLSDIFACHHCYQLAYPSQRETAHDRATRRVNRLPGKLGWEPGIVNGNDWKPKGMHGKTFHRLRAEHDAQVDQSCSEIYKWLQQFDGTVDD
ncbi:MAG: hypothetical protein HWE39_08035 [Oceanospirillaceae bacterium]|nr:hypothetical protein [Oceanospirillaceae bacterium]